MGNILNINDFNIRHKGTHKNCTVVPSYQYLCYRLNNSPRDDKGITFENTVIFRNIIFDIFSAISAEEALFFAIEVAQDYNQ